MGEGGGSLAGKGGEGGKASRGKVWKCIVLSPESQSEAEDERAEETVAEMAVGKMDAAPGASTTSASAMSAMETRIGQMVP